MMIQDILREDLQKFNLKRKSDLSISRGKKFAYSNMMK